MLDKIRNWFIYDPKAKQKLIFIVVSVLLVGTIVYLLFLINFSTNPNNIQTQNQEQENSQKQNSFPEDVQKEVQEKEQKEFDLEQFNAISRLPVGIASSVYFSKFGNQVFYINDEFELSIDNQKIPNSPVFLPYNFQETKEALIINTQDSSTLFSKLSRSFTALPQGSLSVTPFNGEFYFLERITETRVDLKKSANVLLQKPERVATLRPEITNFKGLELRVLNQNLYVFVYQEGSRRGDLEIWQIQGKQAVKAIRIQNLISYTFSNDQFLYTVEEDESYQTTVLDFKLDPLGKDFTINNKTLTNKNIFGNVIAGKCYINDINVDIYCPVKIEAVDSLNANYADEIIVFNYLNQTLSLPFTGSFATPVNRFLVDSKQQFYFVSQINNTLYQINDADLF
jgi:hypothetical protein